MYPYDNGFLKIIRKQSSYLVSRFFTTEINMAFTLNKNGSENNSVLMDAGQAGL